MGRLEDEDWYYEEHEGRSDYSGRANHAAPVERFYSSGGYSTGYNGTYSDRFERIAVWAGLAIVLSGSFALLGKVIYDQFITK